jgi:hypothetical protein
MTFTATEIGIILEALDNTVEKTVYGCFCYCMPTLCQNCTRAKELSDKIKSELAKENKE